MPMPPHPATSRRGIRLMTQLAAILGTLHYAQTVKHERNLIWSQKDGEFSSGVARIVAINGDPSDWVPNRTATTRYVTAPNSRWHFVGLAFDFHRQLLYWSDIGTKKLQGISLNNGTNVPFTVFDGISSGVRGVAVDWLAGNLYWADSLYNWVLLAPAVADTMLFRVVVNTGLDEPMGVAVHPYRGLLFWSDWGAVPKIEKSDLSGADRRVLVQTNLRKPLGLTMDYKQDRLYWVDQILGKVESVDILGGSRRTEFTVEDTKFFGIALYQSFVFVTDQRGKQLYVFNRVTRQHEVNFNLGSAVPYGVVMYDEATQVLQGQQNSCSSRGCAHICVSDYGGQARCLCASGYQLLANERTCVDDGKYPTPMFIYSIMDALCRFPGNLPDMSLDGVSLDTQCFLTDRKGALALAFNAIDHTLFFAENQTKTISRVRLIDGESPEILVGGTGVVEGVAVDWIASNLYWTDSTLRHVMVTKSDGRYQRALHREGLDHPRGIAVDAVNRVLYWTDISVRPRLERSFLDGAHRQVFVGEDLGSPNHLVVDYLTQRVYWSDSKLHRIESIQFDGTDRKIVTSQAGTEYYGITLFQDFVVWTDQGKRQGIHTGLKQTGEKLRGVIHPGTGEAADVIAFDPSLQPIIPGPCDNPGECDQLCLQGHSSSHGTCRCAMGFTQEADSRTCTAEVWYDNFLVFADTYQKQIYQMNIASGQFHAISTSGLDNPIGIDFDPKERKIYWTDVSAKVIKSADLDGKREDVFRLMPKESTVDGIAVDLVSRLLYYTDTGQDLIGVISLRARHHVTLIRTGLDKPRAIALDPIRGHMYWTDWGVDSRIEKAWMDGTNRRNLLQTGRGHWPNGLSIDVLEGRLYWCNARADTIESSDLEGSDRKVLFKGMEAHFFGITTVAQTIFYTDWTKKTIMKLDRSGGEYVATSLGPAVFARANDIHAFKSDARTSGLYRNACVFLNGGCSHLCLPIPGGRKCACPDGMMLQQDALSCAPAALSSSVSPADSRQRPAPVSPDRHAATGETFATRGGPSTSRSFLGITPTPIALSTVVGSTREVEEDNTDPAYRKIAPTRQQPTGPRWLRTPPTTSSSTTTTTTTMTTTTTPTTTTRATATRKTTTTMELASASYNVNKPPTTDTSTSTYPTQGQSRTTTYKGKVFNIYDPSAGTNPPLDGPTTTARSRHDNGHVTNFDERTRDPTPSVTRVRPDTGNPLARPTGFNTEPRVNHPEATTISPRNSTGLVHNNNTTYSEPSLASYMGLAGVLIGGLVLMCLIVCAGTFFYKKCRKPSVRRPLQGAQPTTSVENCTTYEMPVKNVDRERPRQRFGELSEDYYTGEEHDVIGVENPAFVRRDGNVYEEVHAESSRGRHIIPNDVPTFTTFASNASGSDDGFSDYLTDDMEMFDSRSRSTQCVELETNDVTLESPSDPGYATVNHRPSAHSSHGDRDPTTIYSNDSPAVNSWSHVTGPYAATHAHVHQYDTPDDVTVKAANHSGAAIDYTYDSSRTNGHYSTLDPPSGQSSTDVTRGLLSHGTGVAAS